MEKLSPQSLAELIPRPLPSDQRTRLLAERILKDGYVVIPDCFSRAEAEEAKAEVDRLSGTDPWTGRTDFEYVHFFISSLPIISLTGSLEGIIQIAYSLFQTKAGSLINFTSFLKS